MRFFFRFFKKVHFNWGPNADFRHFKHNFQVTLCVDKILGKLRDLRHAALGRNSNSIIEIRFFEKNDELLTF